jgi:hypothetical protein
VEVEEDGVGELTVRVVENCENDEDDDVDLELELEFLQSNWNAKQYQCRHKPLCVIGARLFLGCH